MNPSYMVAPEVALLVRLRDLGSLVAVAQAAGMSASGVSRVITRFETRIGAKLVHRSTRRIIFTPEGEVFIEHARKLLDQAQFAEVDVAAAAGAVQGHLRVNCGSAFAHHILARCLPSFLDAYPNITIELSVCDQRIDPIAQGIDVTVRVGELSDSELIAIRLGIVRRVIAASPHYIAKNGIPREAFDLVKHECLLLSGFQHQAVWPMLDQNGQRTDIPVNGRVKSDSAETLLQMAIAGVGLIRLGDFLGERAIAEGRLVELFKGLHDDDPKPISALVLPGRQSLPRVRAFVDFLKREVASAKNHPV